MDHEHEVIKYRLYADGSVAHEDDFLFYDHSLPALDYQQIEIPVQLIRYIEALTIEQHQSATPGHENTLSEVMAG